MEKIDEIICDVFKLSPGELKNELGMDDIACWDSLTHMDLITNIESEFGILLSGDDIADMQSIGAIREIVSRHANS